MDEIPDELIIVDPRVAAALGLSIDEVKALNLRQLSNRAHDLGYDFTVDTAKAASNQGRLTIRMEAPGFLKTA